MSAWRLRLVLTLVVGGAPLWTACGGRIDDLDLRRPRESRKNPPEEGDDRDPTDANSRRPDGEVRRAVVARSKTQLVFGTIHTRDLTDNASASAEELMSYVSAKAPAKSPFRRDLAGDVADRDDLRSCLTDVIELDALNPIMVLALAIHESAWGTSQIAVAKRNLFGIAAYDSSPLTSAGSYPNYVAACRRLGDLLNKEYLDADGDFYEGRTLAAINKHYARDTDWSKGVRNIMNLVSRFINEKRGFGATTTQSMSLYEDVTDPALLLAAEANDS